MIQSYIQKFRWLTTAVLCCLFITGAALADGFIIIHPPRPPDRPIPPVMPPLTPLSVKYHIVDVQITEQIAVTQVDQAFFNPNRQRLEGTFLFPIPKGAQIDSFSMDIDGKMTEAELLDADKARRLYEDIVRQMKDPALLEYIGQDTFKVRIYPIEPRSTKRIKLQYTQINEKDGDLAVYVYPLNTEKFSSDPIETVSITATLKSAKPLVSIYSPSHRIELSRKNQRHVIAAYEEKQVKPDRDFVLYYAAHSRKDRELRLDLLTYNETRSEDGYFLLMLNPVIESQQGAIGEKDIVFVLDTSGSMLGDSLVQAKKALNYCVSNLNPGDRFEIIRFSTEAEALFEGLVPAIPANQRTAVDWVNRFKARGGTAIHEALLKSVKSSGQTRRGKRHRKSDQSFWRPYYVMFITDGMPTIGVMEDDQIAADLTKAIGSRNIRVFCLGIGLDINTHLLDRIAQETRAVSRYIMPEEDIEVKVSAFYERIANPVLTNISLSTSNNIRLSAMHPGTLPDLFQGDQLIVLGRYRGHGSASITLLGEINGKPQRIVDEVRFPASGRALEYDFVPRLWATRRVGYLLDQIRLHGETAEVREEVIFLAKQYGIVTPYTSYLILEDEARTTRRGPWELAPVQNERIRRELKQEYEGFTRSKSGYEGIGSAKSTSALKDAKSAPSAVFESERTGKIGRPQETTSTAIYDATRYIAGKTFYLRHELWVDAAALDAKDSDIIRIQFGSDKYFGLLNTHPKAHAWLSVGNPLRLVIGSKIYDID